MGATIEDETLLLEEPGA